jgi:hypothetical protein
MFYISLIYFKMPFRQNHTELEGDAHGFVFSKGSARDKTQKREGRVLLSLPRWVLFFFDGIRNLIEA